MDAEKLKSLIQNIVRESSELKNKYTDQKKARVNYAAVFCQSDEEYHNFLNLANQLGKIFKETETGPLFLIDLDTPNGIGSYEADKIAHEGVASYLNELNYDVYVEGKQR